MSLMFAHEPHELRNEVKWFGRRVGERVRGNISTASSLPHLFLWEGSPLKEQERVNGYHYHLSTYLHLSLSMSPSISRIFLDR